MEAQGGFNSMIDLNDSDILTIEAVVKKLGQRAGHDSSRGAMPMSYQAWQDECIDRFGQVGFRVKVQWYESNVPGVRIPEINILERIEGKFDPDRMVHEVTHDLLDLGEGGVIKSGLHRLGD